MPQAAISMYMERLPARQAERKLAMMQAVSIPHMNKKSRTSAVRALERQANENHASAGRKPIPARLRMMGIGVKFEAPAPAPPHLSTDGEGGRRI